MIAFCAGVMLGALAYPAGFALAHLIAGESPIYPRP